MNYSKHTVKGVERIRKQRATSYAATVEQCLTTSEDAVIAAELALLKAKKKAKAVSKAWKKYKKTGNVKHLEALGVSVR